MSKRGGSKFKKGAQQGELAEGGGEEGKLAAR